MILHPEAKGPQVVFENPVNITEIGTTEITAIDQARGGLTLYPYARTDVVQPDNELIQYQFQAASITGNREFAIGAFIYPRIPQIRNNLMFFIDIAGWIYSSAPTYLNFAPFLGRTDSATIVHSVTGQENLLAHYCEMPMKYIDKQAKIAQFHSTIQVHGRFDFESDDDTPFCAGLRISECSGSPNVMTGNIKIDFRSSYGLEKSYDQN